MNFRLIQVDHVEKTDIYTLRLSIFCLEYLFNHTDSDLVFFHKKTRPKNSRKCIANKYSELYSGTF